MSTKWQRPTKEIDVDFLVFIERYVTDLLRWDILIFFGHNPDQKRPIAQIAQQVGRSSQSIRTEVGDLALLGLLDKVETENDAVYYRLTQDAKFRRLAIKLASSDSEDALPGSG